MKKIIFLILFCTQCFASDKLANEIKRIEEEHNIKLGIAATHVETGKKFEYRADERFFMASTVKLPIAAYFLKLEDEKKLSLDTLVKINKNDLIPGSGKIGYFLTYPGLGISNYNLLESMITISENSATDLILKQIGGPSKVREFLKTQNINNIYIARTILQLYIDSSGATTLPSKENASLDVWLKLFASVSEENRKQAELRFLNDFRDTTTPKAMNNLIVKLIKGEILSNKNTQMLKEIMNRTETKNKLRGHLTKTIASGNKSGGWWNSDKKYVHSNDVGYIILPENQGTIAISIFSFADNYQELENLNKAIASASKTIYDYFYLIY